MKICIALTTLSGRSPDRFGDFYKVALPGIEGRSPFLFRCKPEAEGDDRYFYLPGDEESFNKDMRRLMKDSRFNSWGMCVFAIPSDDTAPAKASEPGEDGYTPPTKEEWEAFKAEFDKVVEDLAKVTEMNEAFQKAEEERLSRIPAVVPEAPDSAPASEANKPNSPESPDGSTEENSTGKDSLQVPPPPPPDSTESGGEFTSGVLPPDDPPETSEETETPDQAPAKKQAPKKQAAKKQAKKQAAAADTQE